MDFIMQGVEFFHKGGFVMYILLLCSIFVVAIAVERGRYFKREDSGRNFTQEFCLLIMDRRIKEAQNLAQTSQGALASILYSTMLKPEETHEEIAGYMEIQSGIVLSKLRSRLYYLNVIVTMAPLLGLLGTISGMISAFSIFNLESGQAMAITGGVGEALIATATGLCVAIIALAVHSYFIQQLEHIVTDMEQCFSVMEEERKRVKRHETA